VTCYVICEQWCFVLVIGLQADGPNKLKHAEVVRCFNETHYLNIFLNTEQSHKLQPYAKYEKTQQTELYLHLAAEGGRIVT
jgi:hypothetical protein